MPILDNEILWRPAQLVSDTIPAQNGGRMAMSMLVSGVKNNLFPDVSQSERLAGGVKWRKAFIHINSLQDVALLNARVFLDALTPAGDFVTLHPGTATDTEDQVASRAYGIGTLDQPVAAGSFQILVACEDNAGYATLQPFQAGDLLRISDRPSTGGAGNEEWATIGAVSYGVGFATIDLLGPLVNNFAVQNTLVSSIWSPGNIAGNWSNFTVSGTGTFDTATVGNLIVHNKGAIEQDWTLVFTVNYVVSGNLLGQLSTPGSRVADYAPINPATGTPYFTLKAIGWGGTSQINDVVSFRTSPAAIPLWYRREVPAGTFSLANDFASVAVHGESA
jgi:hypothetical protein